MTREDEIEERLSKTEGTWRIEKNLDFPYDPGYEVYRAPADGGVYGTSGTVGWAGRVDEGEFIANAPEDIRYLLDKVADQEGQITLLRSMLLAEQNKAAPGQVITYHMQPDTIDRHMQGKLEEKADHHTLSRMPTQEELERFFNNA